ncbi:MAG: RDD family protein [bacterium]
MDVTLIPHEAHKSAENALGTSALFAGSMEDDEVFMEEAFLPQESEDDLGIKRIQTTKDQPRAGFWIRSLAFTIDIILISLIQSIFAWAIKIGIISGAGILEMHTETFVDLREFLITIIGASIFAFYFIFFHGTSGQTPGKKLLHLKVVGTDEKSIDIKKSVKRFLGYIVSALPLYFGFIMVAFNRKKQGLHDIIAHTHVIKTD